MSSEFYSTACIVLTSGNPLEHNTEIGYEIIEEKGLYMDGLVKARTDCIARLELAGPELMGVILIPHDGLSHNITIVRKEYAHRFK